MHFSYRTALIAFFTAATAAGFASVEGCASPSRSTGTAVGEHTEGEPLSTNDPYVWAEVPEEDFERGLTSQDGDAPIAKDDITTARMQAWLDRYHVIVGDIMRERGEELAAPKPTAAIFKQWGPNAWVSTAFACPGWNVRMSSGPVADHVLLTPDVAASTDISERCVTPLNWTDPSAFASFFNAQGNACTLSMSGTDLQVSGCQTYGRTAPLATYATSSTISVTIDAITWGEETRVAQTLAHELGHYYRAHSNPSVRRHTDFFYRETSSGPDRPVPLAESEQYERVINQIRSAPKTVRITTKTRYNKRLPGAIFALRSLCPSARISDTNMRSVMSGQITPTNSSAYLTFETAFATCGKSLALDQTTSDTIDRVLRQNQVYLQLDSTAATLDDALMDLSRQLDDIDRQEAQLIKQMTEGQFGWYTDEQEADEIGLELAARAGFKPADVIAASVTTYEQLDAVYAGAGVDRGGEITMAKCKTWLANGFTEKDADGKKKAVHVPVGSLSDTHHDGCYRIYNMWREAKRHDYKVAESLPELTPAWSSIQKRAASLGGTPPPAVGHGSGSGEGAADPDDTDGTVDPEEEAPPPRRPRTPVVVSDADAGAPAMVTYTRENGCAVASGPSSSSSGLGGLASLLALTLLVRRRRNAKATRSAVRAVGHRWIARRTALRISRNLKIVR